MACEQANELFSAALGFAQRMLSEHGEFHPFGVSMEHGGKVAMVAGDIGSEHPSATAIADLLQAAFADQAKTGAIQAAGICLDVKVTPPGATKKTDAICVRRRKTTVIRFLLATPGKPNESDGECPIRGEDHERMYGG